MSFTRKRQKNIYDKREVVFHNMTLWEGKQHRNGEYCSLYVILIFFFLNLQTYEQQNWCRLLENDSKIKSQTTSIFFGTWNIGNLTGIKIVHNEIHMILKRFFFTKNLETWEQQIWCRLLENDRKNFNSKPHETLRRKTT